MKDPELIRQTLVESLRAAAPGSDPSGLDPDADLREELDLDSMDFLNFVTALHKALALEIPERDYRRLGSLNAAQEYLVERLAGSTATPGG
jgi:acyl carrier protein